VPVIGKETDSKEYELELVAQGYEKLTIPVLIEEGYLLNVKAYLFPIPITFEESTDG
jgi:hypothetical protein